MQKGEKIGIQKGKIEVVLRGFDKNVSIPLLVNITGFSKDKVIAILKDHKKIK